MVEQLDHPIVERPHPQRRVRTGEPFVGKGLRDVWSHFATEMLAGVREHYPAATLPMNQVMFLIDAEGTTVSELARRTGVTKQSMADSVAALEREGLVARVSDPRDRRARLVQLTEEGWRALRTGLRVATDLHQRWTALIGARDMARLVALLDRLADRLDEAATSARAVAR